MEPAINVYLDSAVVELHFSDGPYAIINCTREENWPEMLTISTVRYDALKLLDIEQQLKISDSVDLMDFWAIPDLLADDDLQYRIKLLFSEYPAICDALYKLLDNWLKDITEKNPEIVQQLTDSFLSELAELNEDLDQEDSDQED